MLVAYDRAGTALSCQAGAKTGDALGAAVNIGPSTVWIDLVDPTADEDKLVEGALGISIPTRAEAREIEASSRLYRENGALYMTAFLVYNSDAPIPGGATTTFVLTADRLVTVRYHDPKAFPNYVARAVKGDVECGSAVSVLVGLIEAIVDRAADVIERTQDRVEDVSQTIFSGQGGQRGETRRLDGILRTIGRQGNITARLEESTFSLERLLTFLTVALRERGETGPAVARIETVQQDLRSLSDQMRFLSDRTTFLLDATLGAINIQQNQTMKVVSLLAVTLMPPTMIAGLYGMNFKHMPELEWFWGYPMALGVMLLSSLLPFLYFHRKGWF